MYALETVSLECDREFWNSIWSGGMCRYMEEHLWRKRELRSQLTLRLESVGIK